MAYGATLAGVLLLLAATLIGRLGVGWYFLYPLPFHSGGTWPVAGVAGVPRRYANYPVEAAQGIFYAKLSLIFIAVLLTGALIYIWETGRRCVRALAA